MKKLIFIKIQIGIVLASIPGLHLMEHIYSEVGNGPPLIAGFVATVCIALFLRMLVLSAFAQTVNTKVLARAEIMDLFAIVFVVLMSPFLMGMAEEQSLKLTLLFYLYFIISGAFNIFLTRVPE